MFLCVAVLVSLIGLAPAPLTDSGCTSLDGTCVDYRYYVCNAGVEQGLCTGDSNTRCCLNCDAVCVAKENSYDDPLCDAAGGNCQDNSNYCSGSYQSGKCDGPSDRQCCTSNTGTGGIGGIGGGSSQCTLQTYSTKYILGYNGKDVKVEPGFVSSMDVLNSYARSCDVTVYVTSSFRYEGQTVNGAVVPPATYSNHLVGHAIDFNFDTPSGWCNGDCMYAGYNSYSECFIQKVLNNNGLRWGGVWSPSDPVHVDDGLNAYDPDEWDALYYQLQGNC